MRFEVPGKPQGKGRPRFYQGHAVTPRETKEYERKIATCYKLAGGTCLPRTADEPVAVCVTMVFEPNKNDSRKVRQRKLDGELCPTKKPDCDNCLKAVLDALQGGIAFYEDKQVTYTKVMKVYGEEAGLIIDVNLY